MAVSPATEFDVVVIGITFSTNLDLVNVHLKVVDLVDWLLQKKQLNLEQTWLS